MSISRRTFLAVVPAAGLIGPAASVEQTVRSEAPVPDSFPAQDPALVREMVTVSHGNAARVRELLAERPALANAAWDWGFGDWETAIGAASHMGNREIAELLLAAGARPTIFSAAMLGQFEVVRTFISAAPGVQRTRGPHGISLLAHAKAGRAADVVKYLESLGDADPQYSSKPLSEPDRAAIIGSYEFGRGASDQLVVTVNARNGLTIKREDGVERNLFHLGGRVFHPAGAGAVRIRFSEGQRAATVTVQDGPVVVNARRV